MKELPPHPLQSVTFLRDVRCFRKDEIFPLSNITLLVGDQGSGKSTLLNLLSSNDKNIKIQLSDHVQRNGIDSFFFDAEKMNPRVMDMSLFSHPNGEDRGIGYAGAIKSRFLSHGEVLKAYTIDQLRKAKDCVILLDEPESALSLRNQFRLADEVRAASRRNCQLIIATHSLILIESVLDVLSLDDHKFIPSKEFVGKQKNPGHQED